MEDIMRRLAVVTAAVLATVLAAAPALAFDLPTRKPGLWELKMIFEGRNVPTQVMKHCTDAATDKLMNANFGGAAQEACPKQDMKTSGGTITIDAECKFGETTTTSHSVVTGSFDSAYKIDTTSTRQGGPPLPGTTPGVPSHMTIEAKWLGACAAGQKPGDVIMANGMTMNVLAIQKTLVAPPKR
jgi:hypothetical protein